jgi:mRNA (guanine-N7-)-methyltransferase
LLYFSSPSYIKEFRTGYHGKILDLCCGRGVDYTKIKNARYEEIIGMDIDYENIKIAQDIFKARYVPPPKAYYVRGDSSKLIWPEQASAYTEVDKIKTKKFIPVKFMFDTISLQFCFHYFFKDEISFRTILQNLNDNLKIGGFVIGTTFDGERIYNSFKDKDSISGKDFSGELMWRIEKKYKNKKISFTEKLPNFGRQIDVLVKTIGVIHPEYLVNFKYLVKLMEEYGFSMVFIKPFEELYQEIIDGKNLMNQDQKDLQKCREFAKEMSDAEKTFSFFFSAFMFKKERNSSDSLLKKLVELMEKQDKVKITMESNVYKVNKDTEQIILNVEESEE